MAASVDVWWGSHLPSWTTWLTSRLPEAVDVAHSVGIRT